MVTFEALMKLRTEAVELGNPIPTPIKVPPLAMFFASQKWINRNRSCDSESPGEMSLKYMATGDLPVASWDFVVDFIAMDIVSAE